MISVSVLQASKENWFMEYVCQHVPTIRSGWVENVYVLLETKLLMEFVQIVLDIVNMSMEYVSAMTGMSPLTANVKNYLVQIQIMFMIPSVNHVSVRDHWYGWWVNATISRDVVRINIGVVQNVHVIMDIRWFMENVLNQQMWCLNVLPTLPLIQFSIDVSVRVVTTQFRSILARCVQLEPIGMVINAIMILIYHVHKDFSNQEENVWWIFSVGLMNTWMHSWIVDVRQVISS